MNKLINNYKNKTKKEKNRFITDFQVMLFLILFIVFLLSAPSMMFTMLGGKSPMEDVLSILFIVESILFFISEVIRINLIKMSHKIFSVTSLVLIFVVFLDSYSNNDDSLGYWLFIIALILLIISHIKAVED